MEEVDFLALASEELVGCRKDSISLQTFVSHFGVHPKTAGWLYIVYFLLSDLDEPRYLLWTLYFLKNYPKDGIGASRFHKCNTRYFRDKVWEVIFMLFDELDSEVWSFFCTFSFPIFDFCFCL
jgi:hypothetical protein